MKIIFVYDGHTSTAALNQAIEKAMNQYGNEFTFDIYRQNHLDADEACYQLALEKASVADLIFIVAHGGITYFKKFNNFMERLRDKKFFFHSGISEEVTEMLPKLNLSATDYKTIYKYYQMGGKDNLFNMIVYAANAFSDKSYKYIAPKAPIWQGIYHPTLSKEAVETAIRNARKPVIAVVFHYIHIANNNLKHIDALINSIENQGAIAFPVYTGVVSEPEVENKGIGWTIDHIICKNGKPQCNVIINTIGHSMTIFDNAGKPDTDNSISVFEKLGIPVLQAFSTYYSYEKWKESITGLDTMALTSGIYSPEMDGQIGTYPIACHEYDADSGAYIATPIPDRIDKTSRLAINWAKLQKKEDKDKKVAIIFHNMPPRNDMIGCAWGLDSPATVYNILKRLKTTGVYIGDGFTNGDEIINTIIDNVSNDSTWKSIEAQLAQSIDIIDSQQYQQWFDLFPEAVQKKMEADWGKAPGDFMVHDGKMPIPGILSGNVFIGLQPPRAFEEKADECYHSTDIVCPHQYLAFYKWVKHIFEADVIMHIGTHGTLEWLPGKEKGLSNECYPDIAIDDMPHLYVYNISVVGEGIQAKRRSSAVLLCHNIPSLTEGGTYHELSELDDHIKDYYQSLNVAPAKIPPLEEKIWALTIKLNLHQDLRLDADNKPTDFKVFIESLHAWVEKIKMSVIKDGLHIFGEAPEKERFTNMLRQLVRIKNGDVAGINNGVAAALGYNYEDILDNPHQEYHQGVTGHMLVEQFTNIATKLIEALDGLNYEVKNVDEFITYHLQASDTQLQAANFQLLTQTLNFICSELKPRLERLTEELDYTEKGANAFFNSPGPGGCPTRGNALILPSGKNFYAVDPAILPTRASWEVGKRMANDLLERFQADEGKYPESLAIVLYAGDQMKTNGDDIAEILYLLGVKPVWLGNTNRVSGLEIIPLEELKRPRIDVTCRISGLFRDTFPNLIEALDDAVQMVAGLDEAVEQNFIRKHVLEEVAELTANGISKEIAEQESLIRVFGCPPGNYGGGVDILINSKNWESNEDLAQISVTWSCHAYGNKLHGDKRNDLYTRRLSKTDVTVKNEISIESDIYDIDDEFIYHGGMLAAVTKHSGKKPRSYYGNSANPERTSIADLNEETARIIRSRILNPKWIEGLKRHGYKGAQDVSYNMDNIFGWDATADIVEDWMYEEISDHFLFNSKNKDWMDEVNPYASHHVAERLLEAAQRGMWNAKEETLEKLKELYLECEGNLEGKTV
ncbi:cobaltochelatase subunit CobN [Labilibaculum euxinus]